MITDPRDIPNGFWLAFDSGVTLDGSSNVQDWVARGDIAKTFTQSTAGRRPSKDTDGIVFASASSEFLYESSAAPDVDDVTIFVLFQTSNFASDLPAFFAKYRTSDNNRVWQIGNDASNVLTAWSSDGTAATASNVLSGTDRTLNVWHAIVYRKSGTAGVGIVNGNPSVETTLPATLKDSTALINIGGRGGDASTVASTLLNGKIRHVGYFNRALTDVELGNLVNWLEYERLKVAGPGWFFANVRGPYAEPPSIMHSTVFAPSGGAISEGDLATWRYAHHPLPYEKGGVQFVMHSLSGTNEDASGQITALERSVDGGATWTAASTLVAKQDAWTTTGATNGGFVTYPNSWCEYQDTLYAIVALDDPTAGSQSQVGMALLARSVAADGTLGALFRITSDSYTPGSGASEIAYDGTLGPPLLAHAILYGRFGGSADGSDSWSRWVTSQSALLTEPATMSLDGSSTSLIRLWRQVTARSGDGAVLNRKWGQWTNDGGTTWSNAIPGNMPDSPSSTAGIRLSDGRLAIVVNPTSTAVTRDPLILAITDPSNLRINQVFAIRQYLSDTPTYSGTSKTGAASYADVIQVGAELCVVYSIQKERIGFTKFKVPGLQSTARGRMVA